MIKADPHYGEPISKKHIPKRYTQRFGISNLFWINLPNYWRMLYSLVQGETATEIIAFIVDILNHKEYDKVFGYKKK